MSEGNGTQLRFSLEESVWFQKGQEVAELINISLDPNITIHENEQYITIEGALELSGEYQREQVESAPEEDFPASPKFIQQVEDRGEGLAQFSHRFPVDITIPNHRVESIYNIDVEVESFDYAFPERSCMKLAADLTISGLIGEEEPVQVEIEEENESEWDLALRNEEQIEEDNQHEDVVEEVALREENPPSTEELFAPFTAEARKTHDEEEDANQELDLEKTPVLEVHDSHMSEAPDISFSAQRQESPSFPQSSQLEMVESPSMDFEEESSSMMESESSSSSSEEMVKKKKKKSKKQGISITEFLARKEAEEDVAKLKVCIVQSGETIDDLAERYEVSSQQLLKVNQLEIDQDIYEGQVLYIPVTVTQ